ncbi:CHAT domain-containing protein [Streptomyces pilosus]|uniref:CHAT domain-containing protein n=1 Tax=Streptomyces pilosus TaxID=28893 RepID=UPI00364336F1
MTGSPGTYHDARHRLASLVHADLALRGRERGLEDEVRAAGGPGAARCRVTVTMVSSWLSTVLAAELFLHEAVGLGDPDLVAAARPRLARVIDLGERLRGGTDAGEAAERVVREHLAAVRTGLRSTHAVEILHRLRRHRAAGLPAAERTAREAAALVARGAPASAARCALLVELGRLEQARAEADELEARGALTAPQSAALRLRLRQPERAAAAQPRTGVDGTGHGGGTGYGGTGLDGTGSRGAGYGGTGLDTTGPGGAGYGGTGPDGIGPGGAGPDGIGPGGTGPDGIGPGWPWEVLAVEAETALALGDPGRAAGRAAEAIGVFEEHRSRMGRDTLRAASADDPVVARLHHTAVLSQWDLPGGRALAFATVERTRSGFLEAVHTLDSAAGQPAARRAVRGWLQAEARWAARFEEAADALRAEGTGRASPDRPEPAGEAGMSGAPYGPHLTEAEQDLGAAEDRVRRLAPAALAARWGHRAVPGADAVARALPPDTVLLQYHLSDADLLCWVVTGGGLHAARRRCPADDLVATARRFHAACASGTDVTQAGRVLADALLGFCAPLLSRHQRVLVVPPAPLSLVPFHALPVGDGEALGLTHDVSYLPAASLLTRPGHRSPGPDWREAPALLVGAPATAPERGLAPLPGTLTEVAALARMLPRHRVLTGPDADRRSVLAQGAGCAVLHLATHGDVRELTPYLSRMALAGPDHLGVDDLLGPDLDPALVVMSACDTGRGTATAGGDVLGLTRTAVISGARHAVVSLWPVDDITGCLVITRMYRHLTSADRPPVGTALARAQREVRAASLDEREEEYARLAERAGHAADATGPRTRTRARDSGPRTVPETTDPNHPNHWAPFVHVGP